MTPAIVQEPDPAAARLLADPPSRADQEAYAAASTAAAKGVAIVTAALGRWDVAVPVTDYLSVSYDPPTMLVSLHALSRIADAVTESGRFGLSLLGADQRAVAQRLGEPGAPLPALLEAIPHVRRGGGAPALLDGALAWFDVRVQAVHPAATHLLVVGRVEAMSATIGSRPPLVRWRSGFLTGGQPR